MSGQDPERLHLSNIRNELPPERHEPPSKRTEGNRRVRTPVLGAVLAATCAATLVACSSSGTSSSGDAGGGSKSTLTIMSFAPAGSNVFGFGNLSAGPAAAVKAINASGGVAGHPITMITCDAGQPVGTAQGALNCGREAVSDHVLAVIGTFSVEAGPLFTYLEQQSIPSISTPDASNDNIQNTSPLSWVTFPAAAAVPPGTVLALAAAGCKKITGFALSTGNTGSAQYVAYDKAAAKSAGVQYVSVDIAPNADLATAVAQAESQGSDCINFLLGSTYLAPLLKAIKGSGKQLRVGSDGTEAPYSVLKSLGASADGIVISTPFYAPDSSHGAQMKADFAKLSPPPADNGLQVGDYQDTLIFRDAVKKAVSDGKPLTAASIQSELGTLCNESFDLQPPLNLCKTGTFPGEPRVYDNTVYGYTYSSGHYTLLTTKPLDVAAAVRQYAG